jgi:TRAP transporter 4TM/12TM fusion protein
METPMTDPLHTPDQPSATEEFSEHGVQRKLAGNALRLLIALSLCFSVYQLIVAAFSPLSSLVIRSLHVGFLLMLTFVLYPALKSGRTDRVVWYDWLLAFGAFALSTYHWIFEADLVQRAGDPSTADLVVGTIMVVMLFDAARRMLGPALPIVCATFLAYGFFGQYLPDALAHRGFGYDQLIGQLYTGTEGIFGVPTMVSATYIFLFILFGAFLEHAGMIGLFNALALGLVGQSKGGPAKVAVISSGFMGTISGSGVANVLTVGQFTIPLMKRFGYSSVFAGAVEATSSMGGQIMPPVMGAVAFIMAETLNIPYAAVVKAAIIPAMLYFGACFWQVHLEAGKQGLSGMDKASLPNPWTAVREHWPLVLPLAALVYLLFAGYTPIFAGTMGLALTIVLILGTPLAASIGPFAFRVVFWLALGVAAASFMEYGVDILALVILALVVACLLFNGGRATLRICVDSLAEGAKNALPVGIACAIVGIIIGTLTLTGIASTFIGWIISIGENNLFLSLVLTMLTCLVLGMGIPTIPNYIITSSLAGPALLSLGVPLVVSHMFVFYFGIMADLTPPVALAAFAAAPMAKESGLKIAVQASKLAVAGFVVPFMAVYTPALMLQDPGPIAAAYGYPVEVIYIVAKACMGILLWGAAAVGFLFARAAWWERIVAFAAGLLLVLAVPLTDELGWALAFIWIGWHWWRSRQTAAVA